MNGPLPTHMPNRALEEGQQHSQERMPSKQHSCPPNTTFVSVCHSCKCMISQVSANFRSFDRRRVAHSMKVGLALTLVSLTVLLQGVFEKIGDNALWAVLTVVVIFEYTVGATLSKGLNRGLGTVLAALLGLAVDYVGNFMGARLEPVFVGCSVFLIGTVSTYSRFIPSIKAKYDYGVVIFLLTFCLVVVSGYRAPDSVDLVFDRVITVMAGVIVCLLVSICIFPIWAGDDLHKLITKNAEALADSLEECLKQYFKGVKHLPRVPSKICKGQPYDDSIYKGYRQVLISKQSEESLANFASWEPKWRRLGCIYPWKRLLDVGAILRHCAYTISALHGCLLSEIQAPASLRKVFVNPCTRIGQDVATILRDVACDIRERQRSRSKECMLEPLRRAVDELHAVVNAHLHLFVNPEKEKPLGLGSMSPITLTPNFPSPQVNTLGVFSSLEDTSHIRSSHPSLDEPQLVLSLSQGNGDASRFHQSMAFGESLSLASVISLLIEIVARLDHFLNALTEFQEEAGIKKSNNFDFEARPRRERELDNYHSSPSANFAQ